MTTHGRGVIGHHLYSEVVGAVLSSSPVPVLLVRSWHCGSESRSVPETPRLLVPLDGSAFAERALPIACDLARQLRGWLTLVRAVMRPDVVCGPHIAPGP